MKSFWKFSTLFMLILLFTSSVLSKNAVEIQHQQVNYIISHTYELDEIVFSQDFSDTYDDWTIVDGGTGGGEYATWVNSSDVEPNTQYCSFDNMGDHFMFCNSDAAGDGDVTLEERLVSPAIDLGGITDALLLSIDVDAVINGDVALIEISTESNEGPWTTLVEYTASYGETDEIDLSEYAGEANVWISFYYSDGGGWLYGFAIDNVEIATLEGASLSGTVWENEENGTPLEGVEVSLDGELAATTDADGNYTIDTSVDNYTVTFFLEGYNPVEVTDVNISGATELNAVLETVSGTVSTYYIPMTVGEDSTATATVDLENTGVAPLVWKVRLNLYDDPVGANDPQNPELDEFGDLLETINVGTGQYGCVITPDGIFTTNATYGGPPGELKHFDMNGTFVGQNTLSSTHHLGYDLTYDPYNDLIFSVISGGDIISFPPDATGQNDIEVIGSVEGDFSGWGIALDYDSNILYITDLFGENFATYDLNTDTFTEVGGAPYWARSLAYNPADPDGFTIWADAQGEEEVNEDQGLYRYNPATNVWEDTPYLDLDDDDWYAAAGLIITPYYRPGYYDLVLGDQPTGAVHIFEGMEEIVGWLTIDGERNGTLENTGDLQTITLSANVTAEHLGHVPEISEGAVAGAELSFTGDYWEGSGVIDVVVNFELTAVREKDGKLPKQFALHQNYPNPFNPTTDIRFDLVENTAAKLTVYNSLGQEVAQLVNRELTAGSYTISFNASLLSSGTYFYRLEAGPFTGIQKMMLIK